MSEPNATAARRGTPRVRYPEWLTMVGAMLLVAQGIAAFVWLSLPDGGKGDARSEGTEGKPQEVDVTFVLTGDRRTADISYSVGAGAETKTDAAVLPVRKTVHMAEDDRLSVTIQNRYQNGPGMVTCTVIVGERVIKQETATGKSEIAACLGVVPTDPTITGAKVPEQGNGLLAGESRLARNVPIKRYRGPGSPEAGRVTDEDARLSYTSLGGDWNRSKPVDPQLSGHSREQNFDTEASWEAVLASGLVDGDLVTANGGRTKLHDLAAALQDYRQRANFPETARGRDVASQPLKVGGRKAWAIVREIRFSKPGVRATLDLSAVVIVDTGRPRPSYVWIDIPDSHKHLWPDINTVVDSLQPA
ncbi:hypothetical protein [Actinomadura rupiterrae]|uniref:hypothetical protein n=1 Tax=Actinomadura rupiterrae TaxID=559627 RepID=UPI0020A4744E|nr:hypothetical protein [Actinomadura rupiterrae]MCP2339866.1 hypothetical protein [Actinomadura rupiterrae]